MLLEDDGKLSLNQEIYEIAVDAIEFLEQIRSHTVSSDSLTKYGEDTVHALDSALDLYDGEFLKGFELKPRGMQNEDFEGWNEWLNSKRSAIRKEAITVLEFLTKYYIHWCEPQKAQRYLRQWEHVEYMTGWNPDICIARMHILAMLGKADEAIEYYERFLAEWTEGLPATEAIKELDSELIILSEQIKNGSYKAFKEVRHRINNLPSRFSPHMNQYVAFIGRETECYELSNLISSSNFPVITLLGPGGIGKTHLAIEVIRNLPIIMHDGIYFVSLDDIHQDALIATLGKALALSFTDSVSPIRQILNYLKDKHILIVFDSMESLLNQESDRDLVNHLIQQFLSVSSSIKIIITSQQRLNLSIEKVFKVQELAIPPEGEMIGINDYDSVKLFKHHGSRVDNGFQVAESNVMYLAKICQLLGGHPLGLKLAGSLIGTYSLKGITSMISEDLDALPSSIAEPELRHRLISEAVFNRSWSRLSDTEQVKFRNLAIFRGGFTEEAALEVAHVSVETLSKLAERSLIELDNNGRYEMHAIIHFFLNDKLRSSSESNSIGNLHSRFFLGFLGEQIRALEDGCAHAEDKINQELRNVQATWLHILSEGIITDIRICLELLGSFYNRFHRYQEMIGIYDDALNHIAYTCPSASDIDLDFEYVRLQRLLAETQLKSGDIAQSAKHFRKVLKILDQPWPEPSNCKVYLKREIYQQILHRIGIRRSSSSREKHQFIREAVKTYSHLGEIVYYSGEKEVTNFSILRALNLAESAQLEENITSLLYANLCVGLSFDVNTRPLVPIYISLTRRAASKVQDPQILAWVYILLSHREIGIGVDWRNAEKMATLAANYATRSRDQRLVAMATAMRINVEEFQGNFWEAVELWSEIGKKANKRGDIQVQLWSFWGQIENLLQLGEELGVEIIIFPEIVANVEKVQDLAQLEKLIRCLESAITISQEIGDKNTEICLRAFLSLVHLRHGDDDNAEKALQETLFLINSVNLITSLTNFNGYCAIAEVALQLLENAHSASNGQADFVPVRLTNASRQVYDILEEHGNTFPSTKPRVLILQGLFWHLNGQPIKATDHWTRSIKISSRLGIPYDEGMAHYQLARHSESKSPAGKEHLKRAIEIFHELKNDRLTRLISGELVVGSLS